MASVVFFFAKGYLLYQVNDLFKFWNHSSLSCMLLKILQAHIMFTFAAARCVSRQMTADNDLLTAWLCICDLQDWLILYSHEKVDHICILMCFRSQINLGLIDGISIDNDSIWCTNRWLIDEHSKLSRILYSWVGCYIMAKVKASWISLYHFINYEGFGNYLFTWLLCLCFDVNLYLKIRWDVYRSLVQDVNNQQQFMLNDKDDYCCRFIT